MSTPERLQCLRRRNLRAGAFALSVTIAGAMFAGGLFVTPSWAAENFIVATGAELFDAIEDANATPGVDTITIDGDIVLEADLPQITDGLSIRGINGAVIDGDAGAYQAIRAENIDHLSIEGVDFQDLRGSAIHASGVTELVITSVGIERAGGYGVYVYSSHATTEIRDVEVRESRYDGLNVRLFYGAHADISSVTVIESGRVEATQTPRERGALSIRAMYDSTAVLSGIQYIESGDGSRDATGIVVNTSQGAVVNVSDVGVTGPIDAAVQLTAANTSIIDFDTLVIDGVPEETEYALDILASETAAISVSDFRIVGSGSIETKLEDDARVSLSQGLVDRSGMEVAFGVIGTDEPQNGYFSASDVFIQNAPLVGMAFHNVAAVDLESVTLAHNGTILPGAALLLAGNGVVQVTNSTVSDNNGSGVAAVGSELPQAVHISSTTIADNSGEQLIAALTGPNQQAPSVHLRNSIVSGAAEISFDQQIEGAELDYSGLTSAYSLWNGVSSDVAAYLEAHGDGNIFNVDPQLRPLSDNGGLTPTRVPALDGPVIDAGDPDLAGTPALDQRGAARVEGIIDMGSVEGGTLIDGDDEPGTDEPGEDEPGEGEPGAGEPGEGEPGEGEPGEGEPGDGEPGASAGDPNEGEPAAGEGEPVAGETGPLTDEPASSEETLSTTGWAAVTGLLTVGGIALAAGATMIVRARERRQPN